jgi:branched-chain amino acid transport system permease protein
MTATLQKVGAASEVADTADTGEMIKNSIAAAILTFALSFPILILHAESDNDGNLFLTWRPWAVLILCAVAFVGRLLVSIYQARPAVDRPVAAVAAPSASSAFISQYIGVVGLVILFLFPLVTLAALGSSGSLKWIDSYGIQILIYVMLGWGLNIVVGLAGLLDLGYVAFYAVGAYAYALLATTFGLSFWICLPVAGILAAFWGMILGFPVLRLRGDYLAIVTLAFGEMIRLVLINWIPFSGGYAGIASIPRVSFFGISMRDQPGGFADLFHLEYSAIQSKIFLYYVILCLALITNFVTLRLRRLPIGRAWEALREDEIACRSLGINTTTTKLTAFALGAFFGGLAGSFFAVRQGFISPESFTFNESATILAIVVLGGMGSQIGVALAAVCLIGGFEVLRELDFVRYLGSDIVIGVAAAIVVIVGMISARWLLAWVVAIAWLIIGMLAIHTSFVAYLLPIFPDLNYKFADFDPAQYRGLLFGLAMVVMMVFRPRGFISTRSPSIFLKEKKAVSGSLVKEGHG